MKIVVLDAATFGGDLDLSPLSEIGETTVFDNTAAADVARRLADAQVAVVNKVKLNKENLEGLDSLKLICILATGYDNVDTDYCRQAGIAVCNVVGYSSDNVTQLTLAMALSLINRLPEYTQYVRSGKYSESGVANRLTPVYHEISGKTWGIVGYGNIGRRVAAAAEALGCRVIINKRTAKEGLDCVSLEALCKTSDIISVHTPLNESTRGLISEKLISMMKKDAIFINVARGAVADEEALCKAIEEERLGALGIDVYSTEPFGKDHPFYRIKDYPNVCLTPHMAWGSYEARVRCLDEVIKNIRDFYAGGKRNRVDI